MTPKKSVKNTTSKRKTIVKMPKRIVKKEKTVPNMPVNFKISIPITTTSTEAGIHTPIIKGCHPPKFKTRLDIKTKVELANSVARQQLVKEEAPHPVIDTPIPKKKGRKKKVDVVSNFFQPQITINNHSTECAVNSTASTEPKKVAPKKPEPTRRIVTRKRLADSIAPVAAKRQKKVELKKDTIATKIKEEVVPNDTNLAITDAEPVTQPQAVQPAVVEPQSTDTQSLLTPKKRKPPTKRPQSVSKKITPKPPTARKKRTPKGKKDTVTADGNSPSILDRLKKNNNKETGDAVKIEKSDKNAPKAVESRKTSVSSNSNLSWTKDISSSSTTTCITVASHDFVRFNKKLPVIKLTNIDNELKKKRQKDAQNEADSEESDSSSDSSDSDCTTCNNQKISDKLNDSIELNSLHLSASSPPSSHVLPTRVDDKSPDYVKAAERLSLSMKKIDMEIINWISSENQDVNANLEKFKNKMFDILDLEFGVITHCRHLKEILDPSRIDDVQDETCASEPIGESNEVVTAPVEEVAKDVDFVKPRPCRRLSNISDGNNSNASNKGTSEGSPEDDIQAGGTKNYQYYDHHDDDDALSLFAESITGFESTRMNISSSSSHMHNARPVEEYVPKPVKDDSQPNTEKQIYCPTKIKEPETITSKFKAVCEKQTADSTSIYKQSNSTDDVESYQDFNEYVDLDTRIAETSEIVQKPQLMENLYGVQSKTRSIVFGNLCFYNLVNCCRKMFYGQCRFLHIIPDSAQIKAKLELLDERMLVQEYLLLRNWSNLRRRYGMCYVEECAKRRLSRILVEIAYDFIVKARSDSEEDTRLRVEAVEAALLHLNTIDLSVCEDLLKLNIYSDQTNRTLLCDVFLATMSITQNFTRFKIVFLNLTYFMVANDRTFNKDVVEHILERVCILPFEEPVARALIQMMRLTKSEVLNNPMIRLFEKQISVNKDVFEEYSLLKSQCAFTSLLACSVMEEGSPLKASPPAAPHSDAGSQPPAPSPDTTNLDNMNKTTEESSGPVITRTIGMNSPITLNLSPASPNTQGHENPGLSRAYNSSGSSNSEDTLTQNVGKWRNRAIFPHLLPPRPVQTRPMVRAPVRTPLRPPMRPHIRPELRMPYNKRLVTFRSPTNYLNRSPGPKY